MQEARLLRKPPGFGGVPPKPLTCGGAVTLWTLDAAEWVGLVQAPGVAGLALPPLCPAFTQMVSAFSPCLFWASGEFLTKLNDSLR